MTAGFQYICYKRSREVEVETESPKQTRPEKLKDPHSFFYETAESIMSIRRFSDLPITIKTDDPDFFSQIPTGNITTIKMDRKIDRPLFRTHEKLYELKDLPYDNTFLLDTETVFLDNPETLLGSGQHIQIARETRPPNNPLKRVLLRQYNSGFVVVECNKQWQKIINQAIDVFENLDNYPITENEKKLASWQGDQWFVHKAIDLIYDTKIGVLPQEWNVRKTLLDVIKKPKLIHVRGNVILEKTKQQHNFPLHFLGKSPINNEGIKFFKEAVNFSKKSFNDNEDF